MYASVAQITQNRKHQDEGVHLSSSPHSFLFFSLSSPGAPPMPPTPVALQLRYLPDSRPHCTCTPRRLQGVSSAARLVCLVSCTASRYRRFQSPVPPFLCAREDPRQWRLNASYKPPKIWPKCPEYRASRRGLFVRTSSGLRPSRSDLSGLCIQPCLSLKIAKIAPKRPKTPKSGLSTS